MYPNLYYAFKDLFGVNWPVLRFINSFGFFVALSFVLAAVTLTAELRRKSKAGLLQPTETTVVVGKPASIVDILLNFLVGFLLGYKFLGLFFLDSSVTDDPQAFIFSRLGYWPGGIILGALFAYLKWREKNKQKLAKPEERKIRVWPQDRVGEMTVLALVFGLLGAKLFDIFENWSGFLQQPSAYIFSLSGLTFDGGLICAALAIWDYASKHKIGFWHLNDAAAPALMLAYGTGRMGCQVAGDGDWGVFNTAYQVDNASHISEAAAGQFTQTVAQHQGFFAEYIQKFGDVPSMAFQKPGWLSFLPDWFFAYDYPHNVNQTGVPLANCSDRFCNHLPVPVIPTPLYEIIACLLLFALLWSVRKKLRIPGTLFSLYLILNGLERFAVESVRVNNPVHILGIEASQAQFISACMVIAGIILWIWLARKPRAAAAT